MFHFKCQWNCCQGEVLSFRPGATLGHHLALILEPQKVLFQILGKVLTKSLSMTERIWEICFQKNLKIYIGEGMQYIAHYTVCRQQKKKPWHGQTRSEEWCKVGEEQGLIKLLAPRRRKTFCSLCAGPSAREVTLCPGCSLWQRSLDNMAFNVNGTNFQLYMSIGAYPNCIM